MAVASLREEAQSGRSLRIPSVVQVVLASLNEEDLKFVVEVGQSTSWHAAGRATTTHDNINLVGNSHDGDEVLLIIESIGL